MNPDELQDLHDASMSLMKDIHLLLNFKNISKHVALATFCTLVTSVANEIMSEKGKKELLEKLKEEFFEETKNAK